MPEYGSLPSIACAVSPDGLSWTVTSMPYVDPFVEHCSFIRHRGRYVVHSQTFPGQSWSGAYTEGGGAGGRTGVARATWDFDRWPDLWEWAFALPEPPDPAQRGPNGRFDQVHLGVGAASLGNVCVGLFGLWHGGPGGEGFGRITGDLGLVVSNDSIRFRERGAAPVRAFIHRDESPATAAPGRDFGTVLCQGNGIPNVGCETRIYHGRWRNVGERAEDLAAHSWGEVALATLPCDRWGALALNPGAAEGAICSAAFVAGSDFGVNTEGVRGLRADLLDEEFRPIPGFTGGSAYSSGSGGSGSGHLLSTRYMCCERFPCGTVLSGERATCPGPRGLRMAR